MTASLAPSGLRDSTFRTSEILSALSCALDITEGQPPGHAVRTCLIGMRIAERVGIPMRDRGALFYALLLKDLGCSSNAARLCSLFGADDRALKREHKLTDWSRSRQTLTYALRNVVPDASPMARVLRVASLAVNEKGSGREMVQTRCDRGADIASMLGFTEATREAIRTIDEHWDGHGLPEGLAGTAIPVLGRIVGLAQSVEVFASTFGVEAAIAVALERRGRWFDPALVNALEGFAQDDEFWTEVLGRSPERHLGALEPEDQIQFADEQRLDDIARAFARVIDAKSPFTYLHSERVSELAVTIGRRLQFNETDLRDLRRAGLLHDIGKIGIDLAYLIKPAPLTTAEYEEVKRHPVIGYEICRPLRTMAPLLALIRGHHERLDGRGYPDALSGEQIPVSLRCLTVADVYDALTSDRSYRSAMTTDAALDLMRKEAGVGMWDLRIVDTMGEVVAKS
jgi:HD-GYP domain-containing protein (c-di-GMP phosphodiesterase class II)